MTTPKRSHGLDALRILAAFLVIVNHTNSTVFQSASPSQGTWYASVLWYYLSKTAVPLFVMVSGACLLPKLDTWRKWGGRLLRVTLALIVFSYLYYLCDAWANWGLWPRAADFGSFFGLVWRQEITDGFWYLYFYIGLMLMLPLAQRLAGAMGKRELGYLIGLSFGLGALCPLVSHYVPGLQLPSYLFTPMFTTYLGLFFAGHAIRRYVKVGRGLALWALAALLVSLLISLWLTQIEYGRVAPGERYWFMDERTQPSILTVIGACSLMLLAKRADEWRMSEKTENALAELGQCAFGIYLLQDLVIARSRRRLYEALANVAPSMLAVLVWEVAVFAVCLCAAWIMRKLPLIKKLM